LEDFDQLKERSGKSRSFIQKKIEEEEKIAPIDGKIFVVAHGNFLSSFIADKFDDRDRPKGKKKKAFKNGQVLEYILE